MKFSANWICLAGLLQVRGEEAEVRAHLGCRFRGGLRPRPWHPIRFVWINPSFPIFLSLKNALLNSWILNGVLVQFKKCGIFCLNL
jgi:hypothetical protein